MNRNQDVRKVIENSGLRYWQVAAEIGMRDDKFSRILRFELPEEKKREIYAAVERLTGVDANEKK